MSKLVEAIVRVAITHWKKICVHRLITAFKSRNFARHADSIFETRSSAA